MKQSLENSIKTRTIFEEFSKEKIGGIIGSILGEFSGESGDIGQFLYETPNIFL